MSNRREFLALTGMAAGGALVENSVGLQQGLAQRAGAEDLNRRGVSAGLIANAGTQ